MKLYNIFEDIILEEQKQLLIEGVLEDIKAAIENPVYIWFKYRDEDGTITNRYGVIDREGTTIAHNGAIRFDQVGGQTTNSKNKADGGKIGPKLFRIDRIVPNSIEFTKMVANKAIVLPGINYNPTGDKKMIGAVTIANYKK